MIVPYLVGQPPDAIWVIGLEAIANVMVLFKSAIALLNDSFDLAKVSFTTGFGSLHPAINSSTTKMYFILYLIKASSYILTLCA